MGHVQNVEKNRTGRKISFALFAFEVQIFQLLRNFLTAKPSDFFLESCGHFTRIEKLSQNGRPTALSGLREDRSKYILKTRIIECHTFHLQQFFAGTLRKWRLIFLLRYFSLTENSISDRQRHEWISGCKPNDLLIAWTIALNQVVEAELIVPYLGGWPVVYLI